jgi:ACS family allantoate permease-like MFS transporter
MTFFLPDSAMTASWLTPDERCIVNSRPQKNINIFKSTRWKKNQSIEALSDLKTWALFFYAAFTSLPNGGVTNVSFVLSM